MVASRRVGSFLIYFVVIGGNVVRYFALIAFIHVSSAGLERDSCTKWILFAIIGWLIAPLS